VTDQITQDILGALSADPRTRLEELVRRNHVSVRELALTFLEGAIAADKLKELPRGTLPLPKGGGRFVRPRESPWCP
jgi:hypothetical protein